MNAAKVHSSVIFQFILSFYFFSVSLFRANKLILYRNNWNRIDEMNLKGGKRMYNEQFNFCSIYLVK